MTISMPQKRQDRKVEGHHLCGLVFTRVDGGKTSARIYNRFPAPLSGRTEGVKKSQEPVSLGIVSN